MHPCMHTPSTLIPRFAHRSPTGHGIDALQNCEQYPFGYPWVALRQTGSLFAAAQFVLAVHGSPVVVVPGTHAAEVWQLEGSSQSTNPSLSLSKKSVQLVSGGARFVSPSKKPEPPSATATMKYTVCPAVTLTPSTVSLKGPVPFVQPSSVAASLQVVRAATDAWKSGKAAV